MPRTSLSHPLQIACLPVPGGGALGLTFCPGKVQRGAVSGDWARDLATDLDVLRDWGAGTVVTLMEAAELERYRVPALGEAVRARGMAWLHLPIPDAGVPDAAFEAAWQHHGASLRARLAAGERVVLHCRGGLGRTGMIAARLLVEAGMAPEEAIAAVRAARPGAIETAAQAAHVRAARPSPLAGRGNARDPVRDRARGALLGLAVGDALGTTLEFQPRDARPEHREVTGGGPFRLAPGQWTDDTAMALALADSLVARGGLDPADLAGRFLRWWRDGAYSCTGACFDIGVTTRAALARFERDGDPFAGPTGADTAGNGSLMRLAPAVLHALHDPEQLDRVARTQSRVTHGAPQAVQACAAFAALLRRAILGEGAATLLAPASTAPAASEPAELHGDIAAILRGDWRDKTRAAIRSSGYVAHTLEAALWAVSRTGTFEAALVLAVNLGDDADTVGAVAGQLAGALYGESGIPPRWLAPLAWRERIVAVADALLATPGTIPIGGELG